jgi:hypothetical protein
MTFASEGEKSSSAMDDFVQEWTILFSNGVASACLQA